MADEAIVQAARTLKAAHLRADALGGEHQADVATAYAALLNAAGEVDEPKEVAARREELARITASPAPSESEAR